MVFSYLVWGDTIRYGGGVGTKSPSYDILLHIAMKTKENTYHKPSIMM